MALQKTVISVPFAAGADDKKAFYALEPGETAVSNGVFTKIGSIRKRYGTKAIGSLTDAYRLATYRNQLLAVHGTSPAASLVSYSPALNVWEAVGDASCCIATRADIGIPIGPLASYGVTAPTSYDIAVSSAYGSGNLAAICWNYANSSTPSYVVHTQVFDVATGATVPGGFASLTTASTVQPHMLSVNGGFVCVWGEPSSNRIYASAWSGTSWSAPFALITNCTAYQGNAWMPFDAAYTVGTTGEFVVAYEASGVGSTLKTFTLPLFTNTNTVTAGGDTGLLGVGVQASTDGYWLAHAVGSVALGSAGTITTKLSSWTSGLAPNFVASTVFAAGSQTVQSMRIGIAEVSPTVALVAASRNNTTTAASTDLAGSVRWVQWNTSNAAVGAVRTLRHMHLHGRPFVAGGKTFAPVMFSGELKSSTLQGTVYIIDLYTDTGQSSVREVARIAPTIATCIRNQTIPSLCSVVSLAPGNAFNKTVPQFVMLLDVNVSNTTMPSLQTVTLNFSTSDGSKWQAAESANGLALSGGVPAYYDGVTLAEAGFAYYPEIAPGAVTDAGAGGLSAGTYQWVMVYEWTDANGCRHQSAPSQPVSLTLANNHQVQVIMPCLNLTAKSYASNVYVALYRTIANGTTFFLATTLRYPIGWANGANQESFTITDSQPDNALGEVLYTTGGATANFGPPGAQCAIIHRGRLWLAGGDDPRNVWFSNSIIDGEGIDFGVGYQQRFDDAIVALASLDDKLVAFSAKSIYVMTGDGPDRSGNASDFSLPQKLVSDVGCVDPRSIVTVQDGILFQSQGGIYLLTRSLEIIYHGHNVEDQLATYPVVTSATLLDGSGQQRFCLTNSAASAGEVVVYDDTAKHWSTFKYHDASNASAVALSSVKWQGLYTFCSARGVFQEDQTTHLDAGTTWVTLSVGTAPFRGQQVQGFVRIWNVMLNGQYATDANWTIWPLYDYEKTPTGGSITFTADQIAAAYPNADRFQVAFKPKRQKTAAIWIVATDSAPTGGLTTVDTGEGTHLWSVDYELGLKSGMNKLPATMRK